MSYGETVQAPPSRPRERFRSASTAARCLSVAVDVVLGLLILGGAVWAMLSLGTGWPVFVGSLLLLALALLGLWWGWRVRTGRCPGHLALGLRTISRSTQLPRRPQWDPEDSWTVEIRGGARDPLRLRPRALSLTPVGAADADRPTAWACLSFRDGFVAEVRGPVLLGRDPRGAAEPEEETVTVPDFGHTLDTAHARIVPTSEGIQLTAVSTQHATWVDEGWERRAVPVGTTVTVAFGKGFALGDRQIEVQHRTGTGGDRR